MKTHLLMFLTVTFLAGSILGQGQVQLPEIIPPTPTASALGSYGDVPVSLYTGTPNISIPITTIQGRDISLPISFSYKASGIKVEENASWVGMGWSLNAGGVITRSVKGAVDRPSALGGIFPTRVTAPLTIDDADDYLSGTADGEPDQFFFNFANYSGMFILDDNGNPLFKKHQDLLVDFVYDSNWGYFILTSSDGTKYTFDKIENSGSNAMTVSAWYLTKVESASGQEIISLAYEPEYYHTYLQTHISKYVESDGNAIPAPSVDAKMNFQGQRLKSITLDSRCKIEFVSNSVREDLAHSGSGSLPKALDEIRIYKKGDFTHPTRIFKLTTAYISTISQLAPTSSVWPPGQYSAHLNKRLYLMGIQEFSGDLLESIPPFKFTYDAPEQLPYKLSAAQDHWGFYNGQLGNQDLWPGYNGPFGAADPKSDPIQEVLASYPSNCAGPLLHVPSLIVSGANRYPSYPAMQKGTLLEIEYPTGGKTIFEFEAHEYAYNMSSVADEYLEAIQEFPNNTNHIAGGLRLKKQILFDGLLNAREISYSYQDIGSNGTSLPISSGIVERYPSYFNYVFRDDLEGESLIPYCGSTLMSEYFKIFLKITSATQAVLGSSQGPHVSYESVKVEEVGNGYTINHFYSGHNIKDLIGVNMDYIFDDRVNPPVYSYVSSEYPIWPFPPIQSLDWRRGMLREKQVRDANNQLVSLENHFYTNVELATYESYLIIPVTNRPSFSGGVILDTWYNTYQFVSGWNYIHKKETKTYSQNSSDFLSSITEFEYNSPSHRFMTKSSTTNSDNEVYSTEYIYPEDVGSGAPPEMWNPLNANFKHIISPVIEQKSYQGSTLLSRTVNEYVYDGSNDRINRVATELFPNGGVDNIRTDFNYGELGNIIQTQREFDQPVAYIWEFPASVPTAQVLNASEGNIAYTSFEYGVEEDTVTSERWDGNWQYLGATGGYNSPLGALTGINRFDLSVARKMQAQVQDAGVYTLSFWTTQNLSDFDITGGPTQTIHNGDETLGWKYFELSIALPENGIVGIEGAPGRYSNWIDELRLYPIDAQMTTICYDEEYRQHTGTDINNRCMYYEYDGLGRLIRVFDHNRHLLSESEYHFADQ